MIASKIKNTKKIVRATLGIGGLLFSASMIYLFFLQGINQAFILGSTGLFLIFHAGVLLSKFKEISVNLMVSTYNLTASFIFLSWFGYMAYYGEISNSMVFVVLAVVAFIAYRVSERNIK